MAEHVLLSEKVSLFPTFTTWDQMEEVYNQLPTATDDQDICTTIGTRLTSLGRPQFAMFEAKRKAEKSAIAADYITEQLRLAAPRKLAFWMLSNHFWTTCTDEINKAKYSRLAEKVTRMIDAYRTSSADILSYNTLSKEFREGAAAAFPVPEFNDAGQETEGIVLPPRTAFSIHRLVKSLMEKRSGPFGEEDESNQIHLDIIFNFFLFLRAQNQTVATSENTRLKINDILYTVGKDLKEKKCLKEVLKASDVTSGWLKSINNTGSRQIPPFCLTYQRVYDMVMIYGVLKASDLPGSMLSPGIAPRYIAHFRSTSEVAMQFISTMWVLEDWIYIDDNFETERMSEIFFEQLVKSKSTGYQNCVGMRIFKSIKPMI